MAPGGSTNFAPPPFAASDDSNANGGPPRCHVERGTLVITLPNPACTETAVKSIVKWCDYHVTDRLFEETTRFEDFDEDEYEQEQVSDGGGGGIPSGKFPPWEGV